MSGVTDDLPSNEKRWEAAMARMGLTGQTIHGAELNSASKIEYKQFLLLQVLWETRHIQDLPKILPEFNKWIVKAEEMLRDYKSWQTYCQEFSSQDMGEGNFTIARHYQLEVISTKDEVDPRSLATPIAHRTRARVFSRKLADMYLETPSKSKNISDFLDVEGLSLDTPEDTPAKPSPETPSPLQETSPPSKEQVSALYPPTRDEQIVNCALVIFMNALTVPFKLANNWTLHRKVFKATFGEASFEARTDGYLDDRQGNAQAIIEVKPVMRAKKLAAIRMQESAQMVAWVKNDGVKAYAVDKERFLASQDRHEIFLTVSQYDDEYIKFLEDKNHSNQSRPFVIMRQFGPWSTLNLAHMMNIAPILLAISLRANSQLRQKRELLI